MDRKIPNILLLLLIGFIMIPVASLAQEDTADQVTSEDEAELAIFDCAKGIELRFLQLERSLTRNILIGAKAVEVIESNHPEVNVSELNTILNDMEILLEEVKGVSLDQDPKELAKLFVDMKKESIDLTKQFRQAAMEYLTAEDIQEIRSSMPEINDSISEIREQIRQRKREINAYRVQTMLENMGTENERLLERIRGGETNLTQARLEVKNAFQVLTQNGKVNAVKNVKSAVVNRSAVMRDVINEVKGNITVMRQLRVTNRVVVRNQWIERQGNGTSVQGFDARLSRVQVMGTVMQQTSLQANAQGNSQSAGFAGTGGGSNGK